MSIPCKPSVTNPELMALLAKAKDHVMTAEEYRAQRRSYVIAEAGFGSDADEAAMRRALEADDHATIARLNNEAAARMRQASEYMETQL